MKYYVVLILLLQFACLKSQNSDIYISVAMPSESVLDNNTTTILKNKILSIVSSEGAASTECGAIVAVPEVSVVNSNVISGGMRQITSIELGVSITIRNMITNTVFNTLQISTKGEGYSLQDAKRSAINKIKPMSPEYAQFVRTAKAKIIDYYTTSTSAIIAKANTLASQQLYDEALALLATYPESLLGYENVSSAMTAIFKKCQTQYCSQILMSAQAAYSQHNYEEAAELVAMIDAQSSCARDAQMLLNSIKKSKDKVYNDQLAMEKERMRSNERIRTAEIKAIKDISTAYFKRQTEYIFFW